jgi:hypothetical protein
MGAMFLKPPPLLPRLDLHYFTIIHYWGDHAEAGLYITVAPPL